MLAYGAYSLYQYLNPYRQGPCWFSGEKGWRYKPENPVGTSYDNEDYNNWGRAVLTGKTPGLFSEGGPISRAMMYLGGQNAVGTFHDWLGDVMQINGMSQSVYYAFMSIPTMLPAAAFTYAGLINTPIGYGLIASDRYDNSYW
ncbi:MAG: hypothetical protein ACRES7_10925 [Gammaproteobacteria bacterium]